jgi:hypothetical protein
LGFHHNIKGENNGGNITSVAVKIMWMIYTCPFFNKIVNLVVKFMYLQPYWCYHAYTIPYMEQEFL